MVAGRTAHRVQVESRRQPQPLCDGRRRPQRHGASPITPATITIRPGCPMARAWCSPPIAIAAPAASICIALARRWLGRAIDDVLRRLCVHADRVARRQLGRVCRHDVPVRRRLGEPGARARAGDEADLAVRHHGAGMLAELVARRPVDHARLAAQRAVDHPDDQFVRRGPAADARRAGAVALLSRLVSRQSPARRCRRAPNITKARTGTSRSSIRRAPRRCGD